MERPRFDSIERGISGPELRESSSRVRSRRLVTNGRVHAHESYFNKAFLLKKATLIANQRLHSTTYDTVRLSEREVRQMIANEIIGSLRWQIMWWVHLPVAAEWANESLALLQETSPQKITEELKRVGDVGFEFEQNTRGHVMYEVACL
jgi:hypothetical protein